MKKWNVLAEYTEGLDIVDTLLKNRGVPAGDRALFLNPPSAENIIKSLPDEIKAALKQAAEMISGAMARKSTIIIHGDYDADGICATAVLFNAIKKELGYANVLGFIPNRFDHGYGLSVDSITEAEKLAQAAFPDTAAPILWVTVDSGITCAKEVEHIKSLGHEIIVTDHHQKPVELPKADCLVWWDQVVGTTLAWLLSLELGSKSKESVAFAALATVTDLQPVLGVNRALIKEGLEVLNGGPPNSLKALLDIAEKNGEVTTYDLGWVIGPRLNASGRLVDAKEAFELLVTENAARVTELAKKLNDVNVQRQDKTLEMYEKAALYDLAALPLIIFSENEGYHEGIIGLVAAKLTQKYYRPSVVISLSETHGKGSVRSVPGINIIELLRKFEHLFESLGGHPMAAGFTIKKENIPLLKQRLVVESESYIDASTMVPTLNIDLRIPISLVSEVLLDEINKLKPFGLGNEQPTFLSEGVGVAGITTVGKDGKHVSLKLFDGAQYYKAIYFGGSDDERLKTLKVGDKVSLVYTLNKNVFNGRTYVDLVVKDIGV